MQLLSKKGVGNQDRCWKSEQGIPNQDRVFEISIDVQNQDKIFKHLGTGPKNRLASIFWTCVQVLEYLILISNIYTDFEHPS